MFEKQFPQGMIANLYKRIGSNRKNKNGDDEKRLGTYEVTGERTSG